MIEMALIEGTINTLSPQGIFVHPDGTKANVSVGGRTIDIIDTSTNSIIGSINFRALPGQGPVKVRTNSDGSRLIASAGFSGNDVWIVETTSNSVIGNISLPGAFGLAVGPSSNLIYALIGISSPGSLSIINTLFQIKVSDVKVGHTPFEIVLGVVP